MQTSTHVGRTNMSGRDRYANATWPKYSPAFCRLSIGSCEFLFARGDVFQNAQGKLTEANVHMSFDQYMQDQVLTLDGGQENGEKFSTIAMNDQPDYPITETIDAMNRIQKLPKVEQDAAWKGFFASHERTHQRVKLGRMEDKSAVLVLKDVDGKSRIVMKVAADGTPSLQFLDADGRVVGELPQNH